MLHVSTLQDLSTKAFCFAGKMPTETLRYLASCKIHCILAEYGASLDHRDILCYDSSKIVLRREGTCQLKDYEDEEYRSGIEQAVINRLAQMVREDICVRASTEVGKTLRDVYV